MLTGVRGTPTRLVSESVTTTSPVGQKGEDVGLKTVHYPFSPSSGKFFCGVDENGLARPKT